MPNCLTTLLNWPIRRWIVASSSAILAALVIGIPTAVLPTPFFGRSVAVTSWSMPVLLLTSILTGLLVATYIRTDQLVQEEQSLKIGGLGGFFSFIAIGCPVCNKVAFLALGATGAIKFFEPVQPCIASAGIALLFYAVRKRILSESTCSINIKTNKTKGKWV